MKIKVLQMSDTHNFGKVLIEECGFLSKEIDKGGIPRTHALAIIITIIRKNYGNDLYNLLDFLKGINKIGQKIKRMRKNV